VIGELLALIGGSFIFLSALGVVRIRDALARLHALSKASTFGLLLVLCGAAVRLPGLNDLTSIILAGVVHLLASPPASNMLSRATYLSQRMPAGAVDEHPPATDDDGVDGTPP
jgi:multicomponent Na+:H+ antiporter subunit G